MTRLLVACAIAAILASPVNAQGFPDRLIRIIVPFTPGGANDVVAREIATGLQERFKQTAVVENKPGGGGTIAYSQVAKSPPDGYLLLIAPAILATAMALDRSSAPFIPYPVVIGVAVLMWAGVLQLAFELIRLWRWSRALR